MDAWNNAGTVAGFSQSPPNPVLMEFAAAELERLSRRAGEPGTAGRVPRALDIGCGAARNAVPLAELGWHVLGVDLSRPMLDAAAQRVRREVPGTLDGARHLIGCLAPSGVPGTLHLAEAPMHALPAPDAAFDLVIAHGIWNLARTADEFRRAVREAARVAAPGAALFVFTFSRHTLAPDAQPLPGEDFVFTQFSGNPQVFLTEQQLLDELRAAHFLRDEAIPLTEYNLPKPGAMQVGRAPVIWEAAFRKVPGT